MLSHVAPRNPPMTRIVVLTGAGISAESGVPTFRGADGLWEDTAIEDVATPEAYERDPDTVLAFYDARRRRRSEPSCPTAAHRALARLEGRVGGDLLVVTQNIDDLHRARRPSRNLVHMHGEPALGALPRLRPRPAPPPGRPHRSPALSGLRRADAAPRRRLVRRDAVRPRPHRELPSSPADVFVSIGTSGAVYPGCRLRARSRPPSARARSSSTSSRRDAAVPFDDAAAQVVRATAWCPPGS